MNTEIKLTPKFIATCPDTGLKVKVFLVEEFDVRTDEGSEEIHKTRLLDRYETEAGQGVLIDQQTLLEYHESKKIPGWCFIEPNNHSMILEPLISQ